MAKPLKIDFHIHTISTIKDPDFDFDLSILNQYINEMKLDCIAITNHNVFDKNQFEVISKNVNAKVFPGMEVDIEDSHLLVITDIHQISELESATEILNKKIVDKKSFISFEEFETIFPNYKDYLLIPHYKKDPRMQQSTIKKFNGLIKCGEVPNSKKFSVIIKDNKSLIPVVFSDFRAKKGIPFPSRQTYLNCLNNDFSNIRCALEDRNKVSINLKNAINEIEYLPNGATISNKLNIIIGTRTSGKTFNIEKIKEAFDTDNCLYVPQFSLIGKAEDTKFEELIKRECSSISEEYYAKFEPLVKKISNIDIEKDEFQIENALNSLFDYAENANIDSYSKTPIFSEVEYSLEDNNMGNNVINSLFRIYKTKWNKDIINKYLDSKNLKRLILELIDKRKEEKKKNILQDHSNVLIRKIKKSLNKQSSANPPETMNLVATFKNKKIIEKSNKLFKNIKVTKKIKYQNLNLFNVYIKSNAYNNVSDLKDSLSTKSSLKLIFDNFYKKDDLYGYIKELENLGISKNNICRALVNIEYDVKNKIGEEPSGGEKAEFNLLKEISNAYKYDILLIDEPEASFDNPFISENIVDMIKSISEKTTVCLTTHNSTLAMMLKPDKIIFTENQNGIHKVYYGTMGDKIFRTVDDEEIISYDSILNVLEAGKTIYKEKGRIYENFRNKK